MEQSFAIFDMDGTLVNSMVYWMALSREFLRSRGVEGDLEPIMQRIKPMTMAESSALFIRELGVKGTPESIRAEMSRMMEQHYREDVELKPGVREYLEALKKRGVRMGVASATPAHMIQICLERLGVAPYFEFLLSCESVGAGKRQPTVFLEAARRLGGEPENTAVYEDAVYAVETARRAGFYTVGVYDPCSRENWETIEDLAQETICDWAQAAKAL